VTSRRQFNRNVLTGLAAASLPLARPTFAASSNALFAHGVASGDPLDDRVVLWTRITSDKDVPVRWSIATDERFKNVVNRGEVMALAVHDHTVKVDAGGLEPARTYYYRFTTRGKESPTGKTRTLPRATVSRVRFAVASCANYPFGYFNAYARIASREDIDAVLHLGDYYYEYAPGTYGTGTELGRVPTPAHELVSLADYRERHAQYKTDPDLQEAHRVHPWITVWDDHETANNSYRDGAQNHNPEAGEGDWSVRKAAATRAYYEWMPIREQPGTRDRTYRSFRYGNLVDLVMLDARLYGRTVAVANGNDVAGLADPTRTILGAEQHAWLADELRQSRARGAAWRVLGNQCMIGQLLDEANVIANPDQWDGYPFSRRALLEQLAAEKIPDNVVVTGDIHSSWALDVALDPFSSGYDPATGRGSLAVEMITPAVSSPSPFVRDPDVLGREKRTMDRPHIHWVEFRSNGYLLVDLTAERARGEWWLLDGVDRRGADEHLAAAFETPRGANHLAKA
jgi:alkaline phosphatase D